MTGEPGRLIAGTNRRAALTGAPKELRELETCSVSLSDGLGRIRAFGHDVGHHILTRTPSNTVQLRFGSFSYVVKPSGDMTSMLYDFNFLSNIKSSSSFTTNQIVKLRSSAFGTGGPSS